MSIYDRTWDSLLNTLLAKPEVSELEANGFDSFFITADGHRLPLKPEHVPFPSNDEYTQSVREDVLPLIDRTVDTGNDKYLCEGALTLRSGDRARCHVMMPPSCDVPQITIAKKSQRFSTLRSIAEAGTMSAEMLDFLSTMIRADVTLVISGGTGAGKALALDTLVQTPDGPVQLGDVSEGDTVVGGDGRPCHITGVFERPHRVPWRLAVDTGESFVCDGDHNWVVDVDGERRVMTTDQIRRHGLIDDQGRYRVQIPLMSAPLQSGKGRQWDMSALTPTRRDVLVERTSAAGFKAVILSHDDIDVISPNPDKPSTMGKAIVSLERVEGHCDMRCLTVDSSDSTFVIGHGFTVTHNTTMLQAMTRLFPDNIRIGVAEDIPELELSQRNVTYVHSVPQRPGLDIRDVATLDWVVAQFQRMRTDKIIIGETRGKEFDDFLVAANSGQPGSMTTIHADDPRAALRKMSEFAMRGTDLPLRSVNQNISMGVHLVVQVDNMGDGFHRITRIEEVSPVLSDSESASIATQCLYRWDEGEAMFRKVSPISDHLRDVISYHGYDVTPFLRMDHVWQKPLHRPTAAAGGARRVMTSPDDASIGSMVHHDTRESSDAGVRGDDATWDSR